VLSILIAGSQSAVLAQSPGRLELGATVEWFGPSDLGDRTPTLVGNPAERSTPLPLFTTNGQQNPAVGLGAILGWRLARRVTIQGGFTVGWPGIELTTTDDVEREGETTSEGRLTEYLFDGGIVFDLGTGNTGKWRPFVSGGGGYLRQVHDGGTVIESGSVFYGGGGVKYRLRATPARRLKSVELRLQGRLLMRDGGFSLDDGRRASLNVGAGLVAAF
jgi:hypothetical protein